MVVLSKIYTKTGDRGDTGLGDGTRVLKHDLRIAAYGTVDEVNAVLGLALTSGLSAEMVDRLRAIQHDLFDVGADLCVPQREAPPRRRLSQEEAAPRPSGRTVLRVTEAYVTRLEQVIDAFNARLTPLRSFVLPGGTAPAAWLHLARTVCRRAERETVALSQRDPINPQVLIYLNRLSDLLFVMARVANDDGRGDILWEPGKTQQL